MFQRRDSEKVSRAFIKAGLCGIVEGRTMPERSDTITGNFLSAEDWNTDQRLPKTQVAFHGRKREIFAIVFPSRREEFKRPTVASVDDGFDSDQKHVGSRIALCNSCRFPSPPIFRHKIDSRDRRHGRKNMLGSQVNKGVKDQKFQL